MNKFNFALFLTQIYCMANQTRNILVFLELDSYGHCLTSPFVFNEETTGLDEAK